ncbi:hypothetical protein GCM10009193_19760 [Shewanella aestuarii]|nr:hypothetical protein GCM10009193_19760 [Shewanella aestuarii]
MTRHQSTASVNAFLIRKYNSQKAPSLKTKSPCTIKHAGESQVTSIKLTVKRLKCVAKTR